MRGTRRREGLWIGAAGAALLLGLTLGSRGWSQWAVVGSRPAATAEFTFMRLSYQDAGGGNRRRGRWLTDWPDAEQHLLQGIGRMTRVDAAREGSFLSVMDDALFEYPFLYAVEVGGWWLDDAEVERLREYLLRGGFLMVDDFHGTREWAGFLASMERVFPDRPIVEVDPTDSIFHIVYDLDEKTQVPGITTLYSGVTYERDGFNPHWRGIYDDDGRLMVVICFNMDLGDSWEHADTPEYPLHYTTLGYQYAINQIVYAMTH